MVSRIEAAFDIIDNPVFHRITVACHCRSRFPVRLLPSCTTICACCNSATAFAFPSHRSAHGSGCRFATEHHQSAASLTSAPTAPSLPSSALMRPAMTTPRFVARKTSRAVVAFQPTLLAARVYRPAHQSPAAVARQSRFVHIAIQRFRKRAVI